MLSDLLLLAPAFVVLLFLIWRRRQNRAAPARHVKPIEKGPPTNAIVVDGSNVMHWGGQPSLNVLSMVMRSLENKGYAPIVFFDANAGYLVDDRYYDEAMFSQMTGVAKDNICVVDKGVIADEPILAFSADHNLRIVTNDQYRDWRVQFPHAAQKGRLVKGAFAEGAVKWKGRL